MPTEAELKAAHCWEDDDRVPRRPELTEFRRELRLQQARWREAHGHPIGSQPIAPKPGQQTRPVGSRLPLDYAEQTGANFVTPHALAAARERMERTERHQSIDHQRIWADLLWSPSLAFNLFGDAAADRAIAGELATFLAPELTGAARTVDFAYSPGRLDPQYLNSLRDFDAAFLLDGAVVGVDVKYHERNKAEMPKPENLRRYVAVAKRSGVFARGATKTLQGRSDLAVMWLEHLLLLSMLQHRSGEWRSGRYVVVYPSGNSDVADAVDRYRELLADDTTFGTMTLEELLDAKILPKHATAAVRERYVPPSAAANRTAAEVGAPGIEPGTSRV